jgi:hypothetical protein
MVLRCVVVFVRLLVFHLKGYEQIIGFHEDLKCISKAILPRWAGCGRSTSRLSSALYPVDFFSEDSSPPSLRAQASPQPPVCVSGLTVRGLCRRHDPSSTQTIVAFITALENTPGLK